MPARAACRYAVLRQIRIARWRRLSHRGSRSKHNRPLPSDRLSTRPLSILGCRVDAVDMAAAVDLIGGWLRERRATHVVTFGAEMAALAARDVRYRGAINAADLVVPDTVGVVWASRVLGHPLPERVAGIDLVDRLLAAQASSGLRLFVLGASAGVAESAAQLLATRHAGVV